MPTVSSLYECELHPFYQFNGTLFDVDVHICHANGIDDNLPQSIPKSNWSASKHINDDSNDSLNEFNEWMLKMHIKFDFMWWYREIVGAIRWNQSVYFRMIARAMLQSVNMIVIIFGGRFLWNAVKNDKNTWFMLMLK